ncbi:sodium:neurotransmitter symporter [Streptomyces sp. NPDC101178]|uniref:sodium:neurotransmitter symporter n=1 Tax=Streptomyces sp. NPDC101178 TaxID=3366124 RepID=UPI0037F95FF3
MRKVVQIGAAFLAILCGIALIVLGVQDIDGGGGRAALPIFFGISICIGGIFFTFRKPQ